MKRFGLCLVYVACGLSLLIAGCSPGSSLAQARAKSFADSNYSYDSMIVYYVKLFNFLKTDPSFDMTDSSAYAMLSDIYLDTLTDPTSHSSMSYNHNHPTADYYLMIQNFEYLPGWKGAEPSLDEIGSVAPGDTINNPAYKYLYQRLADSVGFPLSYLVNIIDRKTEAIISRSVFGFSQSQQEYLDMLK